MSLSVIPIKSRKKQSSFDLFKEIVNSLQNSGVTLENGDILVISSKYISTSQQRLLDIDKIKPSKDVSHLSDKFQLNPNVAEIIVRESDVIFGGIPGFVIASTDNILAPNAGITDSDIFTQKPFPSIYSSEKLLI